MAELEPLGIHDCSTPGRYGTDVPMQGDSEERLGRVIGGAGNLSAGLATLLNYQGKPLHVLNQAQAR